MKRKGKDFVIKNRRYESCIILADAGFKPLYCSQAMENHADYIKIEGDLYYGITKDQILPGDKIVSVEDFLKNGTKGKKDRIWYDTVGYDVSFRRCNGKILHGNYI